MKRLAVILALAATLACTPDAADKSPYARAMSLLESNPRAAGDAFLVAIGTGDHPAEAHYQYALLCANDTTTAALTAWHLQKFLELKPDAPNRATVEEWIRQAQQSYINSVAEKDGTAAAAENSIRIKLLEEHAMRQKRWLNELNAENLRLRQQLAELQNNNDNDNNDK